MDLFDKAEESEKKRSAPLAERMRPETLDGFVGQVHLVGKEAILREAVEADQLVSLIFWGPPGSGKTTLARIIAQRTRAHFVPFSAVTSGLPELRQVIKEARERRKLYQLRTVLFVDEIHRFNKSQQDAFLPHVEDGTIILIGATTENPSFELNSAPLSRSRVFTLEPLGEEEIGLIVQKALSEKEKGLGNFNAALEEDAFSHLVAMSYGDARAALNALELAVLSTKPEAGKRLITLAKIEQAFQKRALLYDKKGEEHYNIISAFIKSMRGSDPDAALYWLARMLEAGEDPLFICRRMVIFASEDIGNADPQAIQVAIAVKDSFEFVGLPEGWIPLAQGVTYLAAAPKSNAAYMAYKAALKDVKQHGPLAVPLHIRNAPTNLMKEMGDGKGYQYAHDYEGGFSPQAHLPDKLKGRIYYEPTERGFDATLRKRLDFWRSKRKEGTG